MKWQLDIANKRRGIPEAVDRLLGELLHHQREVDSRSAGVEESADEDMDDVEEAGECPTRSDTTVIGKPSRQVWMITRRLHCKDWSLSHKN